MEDILSLLDLGSLFTLIISLCLIVGALLVYSIKILPENNAEDSIRCNHSERKFNNKKPARTRYKDSK